MIATVVAPQNPFGRSVLNGPTEYIPEWDVPSIGRRPTEELLAAIEGIDARLRVNAEQRIHVLLGPPGYGKTHLFGRLAHCLKNRVFFVFVQQIQDFRRPQAHIRHHVVMSLFDETNGGRSALARILACRCRPSFVEYLSKLPRPLDARYESLLGQLKNGDAGVWEIVDAVKTLPPFRRIGDSLQAVFPDLDGDVLRALALGWSPEKAFASRWLRGEAIPEEHARRIGLPDDTPDPADVIKAIAALSAGVAPIVLCLDQLDALTAQKDTAPLQLSKDILLLREQVPNLLIVLSCIKDDWESLKEHFLRSFIDRIVTHDLERLSQRDALDLVRLRLSFWPERQPERSEWWPIDPASLQTWLASVILIRPRGLLMDCKARYEDWAEKGDLDCLITFGASEPTEKLSGFQRVWEAEIEIASADKQRSPENVQDQRLARAFKECLVLFMNRGWQDSHTIIPKAISDDPIHQVAGNPDP